MDENNGLKRAVGELSDQKTEGASDTKRAKLDPAPKAHDHSKYAHDTTEPSSDITKTGDITTDDAENAETTFASNSSTAIFRYQAAEITSQAELEKLIRAIATNPTLTPQQKNTTIQGLRDSVWKSNQRLKSQSSSGDSAKAESMARTYATR